MNRLIWLSLGLMIAASPARSETTAVRIRIENVRSLGELKIYAFRKADDRLDDAPTAFSSCRVTPEAVCTAVVQLPPGLYAVLVAVPESDSSRLGPNEVLMRREIEVP